MLCSLAFVLSERICTICLIDLVIPGTVNNQQRSSIGGIVSRKRKSAKIQNLVQIEGIRVLRRVGQ